MHFELTYIYNLRIMYEGKIKGKKSDKKYFKLPITAKMIISEISIFKEELQQ